MRLIILFFCAVAALQSTSFLAWAEKDPVIATAGKEQIKESELLGKLRDEEQRQGRALSHAEKVAFLYSLVNQRMLSQEAKAQHLEKERAVRQALEENHRQILANALFDREIAPKAQVSAQEVEGFYNTHPEISETAKISQIFVRAQNGKETEAQKKADDLFKRLSKDPSKFADLAKKESDDPSSKALGGDLGEINRGSLQAAVANLVFSAKEGQVLGPVSVPKGFALVYVREKKKYSLAELQDKIAEQLRRDKLAQAQKTVLDELSKKYKVQVNENRVP